MTESTAENVRNLPQSSSAISDEQIEDTEEEVDDLNRPKNVVPSAINFEGFSFAKLMSIEEYKDLGEKLIQYQIDKMKKEKTLPKETKDSDQKCSIAGCNFRRRRGHITCQVHQSVVKIVMRRTNGLKCSVDHCNRRTEISSKDKLCCLCSTIDEIYRVPPIPKNQNTNLINKTEMRQIACNDIQMRLRPWLFYLLVTENPDFDISDLVLYGGFTRRQIVERLEDHKKIKAYTWIYIWRSYEFL
ncbi:hypothetical protein PVAND_012626 [Polypedilum vanderplanki]|uniref:Uncharacterized protein n=1 Tax=Polypedilum vanderplanki TaxID=319348 RepID=A0A9J6CN36_POLVA|nr:hypothetical protein PVAND_012626 [Polypedilum vanderplanki]